MSNVWDVVKRRLPQGRFAREVAKLSGGAVVAQGIGIAAMPVITRLYTPDQFGILGVFISIITILFAVSALGYEIAIPLPESLVTSANLLLLSLLITIVFSSLVGVVLTLFRGSLSDTVGSQMSNTFIWLVPIGVLGGGLYNVLSYWAILRKDFGRIVRTKIAKVVGMVFGQITLGLVGIGAKGLIFGDIIGRMSGNGTLGFLAFHRDRQIIRQTSWKGILDAAKYYKRFPQFTSGAILLDRIGKETPALLLAAIYGPQIAGWFVLGQKVIAIPMRFVGQSVAQVYLGEFSEKIRNRVDGISSLYIRTAGHLFKFIVIPILALMLSSSWLFEIVFGEKWRESGVYVQILGITFIAQFVISPLSQTLNLVGRQEWQLLWSGVRSIIVLGGLGIAWGMGLSPRSAIGIYAVTTMAAYLFHFYLSRTAIRLHEEGVRS
ncbi:lipopolysaccharide biosynthesis protein [Rhodocaloribacter sp.]